MTQILRLFRLSNMMWVLMIAAAAYGLYYTKFQVLELQRQIATVEQELQQENEHLHVVEAEWAYLTRPDRLQQLARKHTELKPVIGVQVQEVATLPFPPAEGEHGDGVLVAGFRE